MSLLVHFDLRKGVGFVAVLMVVFIIGAVLYQLFHFNPLVPTFVFAVLLTISCGLVLCLCCAERTNGVFGVVRRLHIFDDGTVWVMVGSRSFHLRKSDICGEFVLGEEVTVWFNQIGKLYVLPFEEVSA